MSSLPAALSHDLWVGVVRREKADAAEQLRVARVATVGLGILGVVLGTASKLALIYLSPTLQIDVLKHSDAWLPLRNPALVTMPLSFAAGILVSLLAPRPDEAAGFDAVSRRMHLGGSV